MTIDTWARVRELFDSACELDPAARMDFITAQCGPDHLLRSRIEALLAAHVRASSFMDQPVVNSTDILGCLGYADESLIGRQVGQYNLRRLLGSGGMGAVYLAEQENPRRIVALKLIKSTIASPSVLRRFEHEAQLLGRLQHPGIAQIFEAGAARLSPDDPSPQPYFAMEYVSGQPLTRFAETQQLSIRERLALMVRICHAVQHAHSKGVIHRDLKPGNILVTADASTSSGSHRLHPASSIEHIDRAAIAEPASTRRSAITPTVFTPKILDFGVARATDADVLLTTVRTDVGQIVGTLPYMSPEQVRADPADVDTRSDVYSLGVIAYELLSGQLPYDIRQKPLPEAARLIGEAEPHPLSSINRALRGDIENIVATALDKDKERRYQTAADLAADIERYLADRPIVARPPSALYQLRKFARRNRALVAGGALLFLFVVGFGIWMSVLYADANRLRNLADQRTAEAVLARDAEERQRRLAEANLSRAAEAEHSAETEAETSRQVIAFLVDLFKIADPGEARGNTVTAREIMDKGAARINDELQDQPRVRATLMNTMGSAYRNIGLLKSAQPLLDQALRLRKEAFGDEHADVAESLNNSGLLALGDGDYASARRYFTDAVAIYRKVLPRYEQTHADKVPNATSHDLTANIAMTLHNLGTICNLENKFAEAEPYFQESIEISRKLYGDGSADVASGLSHLAWAYKSRGNVAAAEPLFREAVETQRKLLGPDHIELAITAHNFAALLVAKGDYAGAEPLYLEALEIFRKLRGPQHADVAGCLNSLGALYARRGDLERARPMLENVLQMRRELLEPDHPDIANALNNLGYVLDNLGDSIAAEPLYREALAIDRRKLGVHTHTADALGNLATVLQGWERFDEAEELFRECLEIRRRLLNPDHPQIGMALVNLGLLLSDAGRNDDAEITLLEALAFYRRIYPPDHINIADMYGNIGCHYVRVHRLLEADSLIRDCLDVRRVRLGNRHPRVATSLNNLARLQKLQGDLAGAEESLTECIGILRAAFSKPGPDLAAALSSLASIKLDQGDALRAEPFAREALDISARVFPPRHPQIQEMRYRLANCLVSLARYADAEPLALQSLAELSQSNPDQTSPPSANRRQAALRVLVKLYRSWNKPDEAAAYAALQSPDSPASSDTP